MGDLISRQAVIDVLAAMQGRCTSKAALIQNSKIWQQIKDLPHVEPEPHWIPVSERLPEEKKDVLIAFEHNMAVGFWEDILDNGEPVWYANSGDGWMTGTESVDSDGIPIAWMPLPTPWEGGQDGQTN